MIRDTLRYLAALLLSLSIVAPMSGGALAALGLADRRVMVICTGDGLRLMRIGADGAPVDLTQSADPCALTHAAGTAASDQTVQQPRVAHWTTDQSLPVQRAAEKTFYRLALPRAPPVS